MLKSQYMLLCLCYFVVGSYGSDNLVPFIDKCEWSDQACLVASTTKALPHLGKGLPQLGIEPLDPLKMAKATLKEGGLTVEFTNIEVNGFSKCKISKVERDVNKHKLILEADCPINAVGQYEAEGNLLLVPIEGKGLFDVNCESVFIAVEVEVTTEVKDGVKFWKIGKTTHTYEARKQAKFNFENLFNGNKVLAQPVLTIFNENWKEIMQTVAKPITNEVIDKIVGILRIFCSKVPADQLEK